MNDFAQPGETVELPTLQGRLEQSDVTADLTGAGLLVDRVELIARLYKEHQSWAEVREIWHSQRISERGSRGSAQKIFRILRRRLQTGASHLPSVPQLAEILDACRGERAKAQLVYLYLVEADSLVKYVLHEILRDSKPDANQWDLSSDRLMRILDEFRDADGEPLRYATSTRKRLVEGIRSVLHEIGVRKRPYDDEGVVPTLDREVLLVAAGYSWSKEGDRWQSSPVGLLYLFQPVHHLDTLFDRVNADPTWSTRNFQNQVMLHPEDDPFSFEL
ncbi:BrxA family protein [Persicimonas caeni]|uniref:BrxA family protein n=1 Tax=Persicimonas caeni TaxID=2292766 RepID=UPI00143DDD57|nr:BrxA family protein [Persicimonas caeni]